MLLLILLGIQKILQNIAFYLTSPLANFVTGSIWRADGGSSKKLNEFFVTTLRLLKNFNLKKVKLLLITGAAWHLLGLEHSLSLLES